jgi:hypothetical protein
VKIFQNMGYTNRSLVCNPAKSNVSHHSAARGAKLTLAATAKSQLRRITTEEINSLRPTVYKYLLP